MMHIISITRRTFVAVSTAAVSYLASFAIATAQCSGTNGTSLQNPLSSSFCDIPHFIAGALRILTMVALPIVTLFFVYAGFKFIMAQGNQAELKKAKDNFLFVVIGALLIMGAWVISTMLAGTVSQLTGNG